MSDTNSYDNSNVKVLVNKRLKHSYISIDNEKNILVKTPCDSSFFIDSLLQKKAIWIQKQLKKIDKIINLPKDPIYSKEFIHDRVVYFAQEMDLEFQTLKFRKMKRRWGSCTSQGVITLNSELAKLKCELIDYIVVHELAHLVHMNHSKAFHTLVEHYLKDASLYRKELQRVRLS